MLNNITKFGKPVEILLKMMTGGIACCKNAKRHLKRRKSEMFSNFRSL